MVMNASSTVEDLQPIAVHVFVTPCTCVHRLLLLLLLLQTNPADVEPPKLLVVDVDLVKVRLLGSFTKSKSEMY
jgi:hypothetical protein